jgi:hypothetical protein
VRPCGCVWVHKTMTFESKIVNGIVTKATVEKLFHKQAGTHNHTHTTYTTIDIKMISKREQDFSTTNYGTPYLEMTQSRSASSRFHFLNHARCQVDDTSLTQRFVALGSMHDGGHHSDDVRVTRCSVHEHLRDRRAQSSVPKTIKYSYHKEENSTK